MIDTAAAKYGVSPQRLAWTWWREGGFQTSPPDSSTGAQGAFQVQPQTAAGFPHQGNLTDFGTNLDVAARYIHQLDGLYGPDTPSSVAAYFGGPGSVNAIAADPGGAAKAHPKTLAYAQSAFPGAQIGPQSFVGGGSMTPRNIVDAGTKGGPTGLITYIANAAPRGMPMSDAWQHAETKLEEAFLGRGDIVGAQHARDWILQQSHAGANAFLMQAHQELMGGNPTGAAQALAKAHAFVPDGTAARFVVDQKGQIWGERLDEHDPSNVIGQPFQVTGDGILSMLQTTADPATYLQQVQTERASVASAREKNAYGDYFAGILPNRTKLAEIHANTAIATAGIHGNATVTAAGIRSQARTGVGPAAALSREVDKEATRLYSADSSNPNLSPNTPPAQRGTMAEIYHDVRMLGSTGPMAQYAVQGLVSKQLSLVQATDGNYAVIDPKANPPTPLAYISKGMADRLGAGQAARGSPVGSVAAGVPVNNAPNTPIGAGGRTLLGQVMGVNNNLAGTQMPGQEQPQPQPVQQPQQVVTGAPSSSAIPTGQ